MSSLTIFCPQCHHAHDIPEHYLAEQTTRLLKCASCSHVWRHYTQEMPEYERRLRDLLPTETVVDEKSQMDIRLSGQKQLYKKAVHHYHVDWWILVISCVIAGVVLFVEVGTIPNLHWFYTQGNTFVRSLFQKINPWDTALGNHVSLHVLTSTLEGARQSPVLVVKGEVYNASSHTYSLPAFNVHLMDTAKDGTLETRCTWEHHLDKESIAPGEKYTFETRGDAKAFDLPASIVMQFKKDASI